MIALLLYPLNLVVYALRYWPIPTLLVSGAIIAGVITIAVTTGGARQLSLPEYQRWCDQLALEWATSLLNARSSDDLIQGLDTLNSEADKVRPPEPYIADYGDFIREIDSAKMEVESVATLIDVAAAVGSFFADAVDVMGWDIRADALDQLAEDGSLSAEEVFGSSCGIYNIDRELQEWNASLSQDDTAEKEPAQQSDREPLSVSQQQEDMSETLTQDRNGDSRSETDPQTDSQQYSEDQAQDQPSADAMPTISKAQVDAAPNICYESTAFLLGTLTETNQMYANLEASDLEASDCPAAHFYVFSLDSSEFLTISLQSGDFDSYLVLEGGSPGVHLDNDDFAGCCDAQIQAELGSGRYEITVSAYNSRDGGDYRLTVVLKQKATSKNEGYVQDDRPMSEDNGMSEDNDPISGDQFIGDHGGTINQDFGRSLPQLATSLSDRQREVQLGPWFYRALFQFSDDKVRYDQRLGLIGYNYYNSNWPSSVCSDSDGNPLNYGWDAQPYEASPDGRRGVSDWRTRSWHSVYSVIHGTVVYVHEQLGDIAIFDGRNTIYYKHLNEIDLRIVPGEMLGEDGVASEGVEVFPGDYLGRMGMRGTAIAPHITLEVRTGLPPHELCPPEGTATSPLPYFYRLLGGR